MDRLESMKVFAAVVEEGGFSAAGRRLSMPLASVSRKVSELERHLKLRLLTRSTRQVAPTSSGEQYYRACRRILDDIEEAERSATGEYASPRGELIITAPILFGRLQMVPVIGEFLEAYPEIEIKLQLADRVLHLLEEHIDLAVRIGALPDSSLVASRVGEVRRVVCASPNYLESRGIPEHPGDLAVHNIVAFGNLDAPREWIFRDVAAPVFPRLTVTTADAAIDAVLAGGGITRVLSYQVAAAVANGDLVIVLKDFEPEAMPVSLVYPGGRFAAQKLRAFVEFATPRLKARLPAD